MKRIYEFTQEKEEEIEEEIKSNNEAGEEVTTKKKSKVKTPHTFFIRKPVRQMFDDAELFYGVQLSEGIKKGLLTRAQLSSKFADEGKTFSENERKRYIEDSMSLLESEKEYQKLSEVEDKNKEQKDRVEWLKDRIISMRRNIQEFESIQSSLFDYTAETRARNKTVLWWLFNLSYTADKNQEKKLFENENFEDQLGEFDTYEENDNDFMIKILRRLMYAVNLWYMGRASTQQEFEKLIKLLENEGALNETELEEKLEKKSKKEEKSNTKTSVVKDDKSTVKPSKEKEAK